MRLPLELLFQLVEELMRETSAASGGPTCGSVAARIDRSLQVSCALRTPEGLPDALVPQKSICQNLSLSKTDLKQRFLGPEWSGRS